jgi:hypothetical protein
MDCLWPGAQICVEQHYYSECCAALCWQPSRYLASGNFNSIKSHGAIAGCEVCHWLKPGYYVVHDYKFYVTWEPSEMRPKETENLVHFYTWVWVRVDSCQYYWIINWGNLARNTCSDSSLCPFHKKVIFKWGFSEQPQGKAYRGLKTDSSVSSVFWDAKVP